MQRRHVATCFKVGPTQGRLEKGFLNPHTFLDSTKPNGRVVSPRTHGLKDSPVFLLWGLCEWVCPWRSDEHLLAIEGLTSGARTDRFTLDDVSQDTIANAGHLRTHLKVDPSHQGKSLAGLLIKAAETHGRRKRKKQQSRVGNK